MADMTYKEGGKGPKQSNQPVVHKTPKKPSPPQKTQGATLTSGLSKQAVITKKTARGNTTGQRPKCPTESGPGPFTFKA